MEKIQTAVILAGGKGTRFSEYTHTIPKPMIKAKGVPLLIHIMNIFRLQGIKKFIVLAGYKVEVIQDYFQSENFLLENNFFYGKDGIKVQILDTGIETQTGGRIKRAIQHIDEENFFLTYGDGVSNIELKELYKFHFDNPTTATLTAVRPPARFGSLDIGNNSLVKKFGEKNNSREGWINGGFFILNKSIASYISGDFIPLEKEPLEQLANQNQLKAYMHSDYWRPIDTIRELEIFENELENGAFRYYE